MTMPVRRRLSRLRRQLFAGGSGREGEGSGSGEAASSRVRRVGTLAGMAAGIAMLLFLFDREEVGEFPVPRSECRQVDAHSDVWTWPLPAKSCELARCYWPRGGSSFLWLGDHLLLKRPTDAEPTAAEQTHGWHRVSDGELRFKLPRDTGEVTQPLRLELHGPMSIRREFAWLLFIVLLFAWAACRGWGAKTLLGSAPFNWMACAAPVAFTASWFVQPHHGLPEGWRSSLIGLAFSRLDAVAPGLLLVLSAVGWWSDRRTRSAARKAGVQVAAPIAARPDHNTIRFIRLGWLSGVTFLLVSYVRLLSWGIEPVTAWYPAHYSAPFRSSVSWSDANGYVVGAGRLLQTGKLDEWNQRRPVNAAMFSTRLGMAGGDRTVAMWLQAVAAGFSAAWCARELALTYGWRAATAALALWWGCLRIVVITTLSESLGLTLGLLGLAGILRWLRTGSSSAWLGGIGLLALGQAARPGAMFVLPALCLAAARSGSRRRWFALAAAAAASVAVGLAVNPLLSKLYGHGENTSGSNFAYTFVGLATGQNWKQAAEQYREQLDPLPNEAAVARFLYREGWRLIREHPSTFLRELVRGELQFWRELPSLLLAFSTRGDIDRLEPTLWLHRLLLAAIGLMAILRTAREASRSELVFWMLFGAGCLASIPIVYLDGGARVLAATWPTMLGWYATALRTSGVPARAAWPAAKTPVYPLCFAALCILAVAGPALMHDFYGIPKSISPLPLATTVSELRLDRYATGPVLTVGEGQEISWLEWQRELQLAGVEAAPDFQRAAPRPPFRFRQSYDARSRQTVILFEPADSFDAGRAGIDWFSVPFGLGRVIPLQEPSR